MNRLHPRSTLAIVALTSLALLASACGSDSPKADQAATTKTTTADTKATVDASLPALRVGWSSVDAGPSSFPAMTDGALAAADYINAELGGVHGRKLELVVCTVGADAESNQRCGQQFANDKGIALGVVGFPLAGASLYAAMDAAHKPVVAGIPVGPGDFNAPENTSFLFGGTAAQYSAVKKLIGELGAKKISILYTDNVSSVTGTNNLRKELEADGRTVKSVPVASGATDALPQVVASDAAKADFIFVNVGDCVPVAQALKSVGATAPAIAGTACLSAKNISANPTVFEGWYQAAYTRTLDLGRGANPDTDLFLAQYPTYGKHVTDPPGTFSQTGWGEILTVRDILEKMPKADVDSSAAVLAAVRAFTGPVVMGATSGVKCPGPALYPAVCSLETIPYRVHDGVLKEDS